MANILLSAKGIKIRFGGVIAADGIDLDVYEGENSPSSDRTAPARRRFSTYRRDTSGRRPAA